MMSFKKDVLLMKSFLFFIVLWLFSFSIGQAACSNPREGALFKKYKTFFDKIDEETRSYFFLKGNNKDKKVAFTFDDGPIRRTPALIHLLKRERVPATFFLICQKVKISDRALYQDPLFTVGMHGFDHSNYMKMTGEAVKRDVTRCVHKFRALNLPIDYFRPPYGVISKDLVEILRHYHVKGVLWTIDSFDWNHCQGEALMDHITYHLSPGSIILFHDRVNLQDLERVIAEIRGKGFKIVSLKQLLTDS